MSHAIDLFSSLMNSGASSLPTDIASLLKEGESSLIDVLHYDKLTTSIRRYDRSLLDYFVDPAVLDGVLSVLFKCHVAVSEEEKDQLSLQAFNVLSVNEDSIRNSLFSNRGLLESFLMPLPYPPAESEDTMYEDSSQTEEETPDSNLKIDIIIITSLLAKFFMKDPESSLRLFSCGDNLLKIISQLDSQSVYNLFLELIISSPSSLIELTRDYNFVDFLINIIYTGNPQISAGAVINTSPGSESLSQRCRTNSLMLLSAMLNNYNSDLARFIFSNYMGHLATFINSMPVLLAMDKPVQLDVPISQISDSVHFIELASNIIAFASIYYSNLCFTYYHCTENQKETLIQALNEFALRVGNAFDLIFSYDANPSVVVSIARLIDIMSSKDVATEVNEEMCDSKTTAVITLKECLTKFNVHKRLVYYCYNNPNFTSICNILASIWGRVLDNYYNSQVIAHILNKSEIILVMYKCLQENPNSDFMNCSVILIGSINQYVENNEMFDALEDYYNKVYSRPLTYSDPRLGTYAVAHAEIDNSSDDLMESEMLNSFNSSTVRMDDWSKFTSV